MSSEKIQLYGCSPTRSRVDSMARGHLNLICSDKNKTGRPSRSNLTIPASLAASENMIRNRNFMLPSEVCERKNWNVPQCAFILKCSFATCRFAACSLLFAKQRASANFLVLVKRAILKESVSGKKSEEEHAGSTSS